MASRLHNSGISNWTPDQLVNLSGKTFLITGGNAGIGFEAARMLAAKGARIIIAARDETKGSQAVARLKTEYGGDHELVLLDLSKQSSVRSAADQVKSRFATIDGLINNAGIMQTPETRTEDGFELQFATNHLGHFSLAARLFDILNKESGRIAVVSSIAHKYGKIHFDDPMLSAGYDPTTAYCQSKLANLMFALELNDRLKAAGSKISAIACHPGYSNTQLQSTGPSGFFNALYKLTNPLFAQSSNSGAIPTVLAAAGSEAQPGGYYGPQSMRETRGPVSDAIVAGKAQNKEDAKRLWALSEELVAEKWGF